MATDGHVMVTQRTDDGAEARVEASAKRAAATMSALANRTVGGAKVSDVTWVMCDPEGTPKAAVCATPESPSVATAAGDASTDQSVTDVLAGTDGWAISTDTHDALPDPRLSPPVGRHAAHGSGRDRNRRAGRYRRGRGGGRREPHGRRRHGFC